MKKLISIIATVAIVLSMGVTALAAGSEKAELDTSVKAETEKGPVDVTVPELDGNAIVALEKATTGFDATKVIDVADTGSIAFAFDGAGNVKKVLAYNGTAWEELAFTVDGNKITVTVKGAGTIAFLVEEAKAAEPAKEEGKASAQTGYNSAAYIVCAVVLAAGAAFFFGTSKKSVKEM